MKGTGRCADKVTQMRMFNTGMQLLHRLMKQAGPYMLIELLLPGGTLFSLILLFSRSGAWNALQSVPVVWQHPDQSQVLVERRVARNPHALVSTSRRAAGDRLSAVA